MPQPRPYSIIVALAAIPLVVGSLPWRQADQLPLLLLFSMAYALLCLYTYTLGSGVIMTAAAPLATTAMLLFSPAEMFPFVVPGMLVVMVRNRRPWGNTLINITAVGGGLAVGALLYREMLLWTNLTEAPLIYRLIPFAIAVQVRELVNHALVSPVIARQRGLTTWQVLVETTFQTGLGSAAVNATGLGFATLVQHEGPGVLPYIVLLLLGMHAAVAFYVRRSEMQRTTEQDGLTLVRNRRAYDRVALRQDWRGTVVVMDCDGLKQVNDTMGHLAGDEMLKALAHRLSAVAGEQNVFRYGGDEFVVLLERESLLGAVHQAVEETEAQFGASASLGTCQVPQEAGSIAQAFPLADERMYAAKAARRLGRTATEFAG